MISNPKHMYAVINSKTGKFVYGTDYRYSPTHQRTSDNQMLTEEYLSALLTNMKCNRRPSKDYKPIRIKNIEWEYVDKETIKKHTERWVDEDE